MHLKSAAQFFNLDRKKLILQKKRLPLQDTQIRRLVPEFSGFLQGWSGDDPKSGDRIAEVCLFALERSGDSRPLELGDLLEMHRRIAGTEKGLFRVARISTLSLTLSPIEPDLVVRALGRFFEWAGGQSFQEMHPVEQMTIGQVRLFELQPFEGKSDLTALLFPCLFILQRGYLLPLFRPREAAEFREAMILAVDKFETAPLVGLNVKACERAYDAVL